MDSCVSFLVLKFLIEVCCHVGTSGTKLVGWGRYFRLVVRRKDEATFAKFLLLRKQTVGNEIYITVTRLNFLIASCEITMQVLNYKQEEREWHIGAFTMFILRSRSG
jgi:hypothetical protein